MIEMRTDAARSTPPSMVITLLSLSAAGPSDPPRLLSFACPAARLADNPPPGGF